MIKLYAAPPPVFVTLTDQPSGAVGCNTRCVCYWSVVPRGWGGTIFVPSRDRVIVPSCLSDLPDNDTTECSIQGDVSVAPRWS